MLTKGRENNMSENRKRNPPYLSGVITDLNGNVISKVVLWINRPRDKKSAEQNTQEVARDEQ